MMRRSGARAAEAALRRTCRPRRAFAGLAAGSKSLRTLKGGSLRSPPAVRCGRPQAAVLPGRHAVLANHPIAKRPPGCGAATHAAGSPSRPSPVRFRSSASGRIGAALPFAPLGALRWRAGPGRGEMERTRWIVEALAGMVMALVATSPASAHEPSLDRVTIVGDAVVGSPLRAVIAGTVDPSAVEYRWCHQRAGAGDKCAPGRPIGTSQGYVPVANDAGKPLLVKASANVGEFTLEATSAPTAPVGVAAPLSPTIPTDEHALDLRYMRPFPLVRMRGVVAAKGSHVDLLTVTAPRTATVRVRCAGDGCPIGRATRRP